MSRFSRTLPRPGHRRFGRAVDHALAPNREASIASTDRAEVNRCRGSRTQMSERFARSLRMLVVAAVVASTGIVLGVVVGPAPVAQASSIDLTGVWSGAGPWTSSTPGGIGVSIDATAPTGGAFSFGGTQTLQPAFNAPPDPFPYSAEYVPTHESFAFTASWASTITNRGTMTVNFSEPVLNPILHIDRLGGTQADGNSNSSSWEITTPGATFTQLAGVGHLDVTPTTFVRTPGQALSGATASCSASNTAGTACGSIQINGIFTQLDFEWFGAGTANLAAADGIEFTFEASGIPVVDFTKTSDASGLLVDGEIVEYTIDVANTSTTAIPEIVVTDFLPSGMVYVPESTSVTYDTATVNDTILFTDTFTTGGLGPWNADNNGQSNDVNVVSNQGSNRLHLQDNNVGAWRSVPDLTPYDSAQLTFDFRRVGWENNEQVDVYARADVTGESTTNANCDTDPNWDLIGSITRLQATDPGYQSAAFVIPAPLLTSTAGVCLFTNGVMTNGDDIYFDDISVVGQTTAVSTVDLDNVPGGATPDLVDGTPDPGDLVAAADAITLQGGRSMTVTFQAVVDSSTIPANATEITNNATFDGPNLPTPETTETTDPLAVADLSVTKTDSGPVVPGGQVTYTITVSNAGPTAAVNTVVTDTLDPNLSIDSVSSSQGGCTALPCSLGDIPLNGSATITVVATASATSPTAGTLDADANEPGTGDCTGADICNEAAASSDSIDWDPSNNADDEPTDVLAPELDIVKSDPVNADEDGSGGVSEGDTLTYTVTATNPGLTTLSNVVVTDDLNTPADTTTCDPLAPAATCVLTVTYVVTAADVAAGEIVNTATADSDETNPVDDSVTTPVPKLSIVKSVPVNADEDGSGGVSEGDTLTYTVTATNDGTVDLSNVVVADDLNTPVDTVTCDPLAPAATCVLTVVYIVTAADVTAGEIVNTATADSDETLPVDDSVTTPVSALSVVKADPVNADEDGSGGVSEGDTLTYTITATNDGTTSLSNVVVTDDLNTPADTITCDPLAPAATCVLTVTYVVTAADVAAGEIVNTATADSDETNPVGDIVTTPVPKLSIVKSDPVNADEDGSGGVSEGDTLTYTVTATNDGTTSLSNVVVTDDLNAPADTITCDPLVPAGTCVLTVTYVVTAADVAAGEIVNTATADSDETNPVDDTVTTPVPKLSIVKSDPVNADEDGSGGVSEGDTLTYTVTATNDGTTSLSNVVVSDDLNTPADTTTCDPLAPAGTCVLTVTYLVTAADVAAGEIVNTATADSDETLPVDDTVTTPVPKLSIVKSDPVLTTDADTSGGISEGDTITYTVTATNDGTIDLSNVVVADDLNTPADTTTCDPLAPAGTCVLIVTYLVTAADVTAGEIVNTATADSDETNPVDDSVTTPVPKLSIVKTVPVNADEDGSGGVSEGDTLTYTVTATNDGTVDLSNVVVSDDLNTPVDTVTCDPLAPAGTCVLTVTYVVTAADVAAGEIVNTATADSDETLPVGDSVTTPVPKLSIVKADPVNADEDGSGGVSEGDTLTYTVTATNVGTTSLSNVVVSDDLNTPADTITCDPLLPNGSCVLTVAYVVTAADVTAGQIVNTATADSDETNPVDDTVTTPVPKLSIVKSDPVLTTDADTSGGISEGDTITYTITATNDGTTDLSNVVVTDDLNTPADTVTCDPLAPAATCVLTVVYTVTAADVTAGEIVNTATADSDETNPVDDTVSTPVPKLSIVKSDPVLTTDADTSGGVSEGDTLTYTVTATNDGTTSLSNVVVTDDLNTPADTTTCDPLAPAGTCVLTVTYVVTAADVTAGEIVNTATADSGETNSVDDTVTTPVPKLSIVKSDPVLTTDADTSGGISGGDTLTYTVTATNDGTVDLSNVVVTDDLNTPADTITCDPLAPAGTCVLTVTYVVTAADVTAGEIVNTATADSDDTLPVDDTVTTPVSALSIVKADPVLTTDADTSGGVSEGDTLTYTITATNDGTSSLSNVVVTDDLNAPADTITCDPLLPAGTCVLTVVYTVTAADVTAGEIVNTATADSDATNPVDDTVTTPVPKLSIVKSAPVNADEDGSGGVSEGDTLTYTVTATNDGTTDLSNVVVTDDLNTPADTITCDPLAPAGTCVLTVTYVVTAADVTAGEIVNTATADSDDTLPVDDTVTTPVSALSIVKSVPVNADEDGSGGVSEGDTLTYTVTATNDGTVDLSNVVVTDDLNTPADTVTCDPLAPAATCVLTVVYVVTAADVTAGEIVNTATADSDETNPVDDSVTTPVPRLSIVKSAPVNADEDGSGGVSDGDTLTYTVTATNDGTTDLSNVVVTDDLNAPADTTTCDPLAPAGTCVLTVTYVVTAADVAAGEIVNTATADSDDTLPVDDSVTTPVSALSIVKSDPVLTTDADASGGISGGDTLTYTVTATNDGTADLSNVVVTDDLNTPADTITCDPLAPAATCVLTVTYVVTAADVAAGEIVNTATADSDETNPVDDTVTTPVPKLSIVKSDPVNADEDVSGGVSEGDTLTYTVTATNDGTVDLSNVVVTDDLNTPADTVTCDPLLPAATCVLTVVYTVTAADVTAGEIVNTATADSDETNPVDDTVTTPVPKLSIVKSDPVLTTDADTSGGISEGDTITYTITATNDGTVDLSNVVVTDDLNTPADTITCDPLAPAGPCVLTVTYVVTATDVTAGEIVNTATADSDETNPVDDTVTTPISLLAIVKSDPVLTTDADTSGGISEGDTITYTITATNDGTTDLSNVVVTDDLNTPADTVTCDPLLPAATCVLTVVYTVTAADVTAGEIVNTATADSDETNPVDDSVTTPVPKLSIVKSDPVLTTDADTSGGISEGDTITYTVTATNDGTVDLSNVVVTDDLNTPADTITCDPLAPAGPCVLTVAYVVTAADVTAGEIVNTATADSDETNPVDDTVTTPVPKLSIVKSDPVLTTDADGSTDISEGDTITYTITATNDGTTDLTNVVVSDDLNTPADTTTCDPLAPAGTCVLTVTYVVTAADVTAGEIVNTASADSNETNPVDDTVTTPISDPELSIVKSDPVNADEDGSGDVSVGDTLTYTITATNSGDATLTNVVVSDDLNTPADTTTCTPLAPTGTCVLTVDYVVTAADVAAGEIVNVATADSDQTPEVDDTVTVPVDSPALTIVKPAPNLTTDADGSGDISAGDTLTYTITATNSGAANLTNVVVTDDLNTPADTTTCSPVAPAGTCVLTVAYTVTAADVTAGEIVNVATADSDQTGEVNDTVTVTVPAPALSLAKSAADLTTDADGSGDISAGDTLTYTITATNSGDANLTNLVVTDPMLDPTSITCGTATPVAPTETCVLVGTYVVTPTDVANGNIVNTATADSDQTGEVDDTVTTPLLAPLLVIEKNAPSNADEDGSGDVSVDDTLTYTITATNVGTSTLTDVVVSDPLLTADSSISCPTVLPGGTCILTGSYVVAASDVTAGEIVNTATADSDQTDEVDDTETTPVPLPGLAIAKDPPANADEDGSGDVSVGDTLTYTVRATNTGSATLTDVMVTDPLLAVGTPDGQCATLAPGAICTLVGTYVVTSTDAGNGSIVNVATADSDQTDPVDDTVTVPVPLAALTIVKGPPTLTVDADGSLDISAGDTLTYTVTATNVGGANLTDVSVIDPLLTPNQEDCPLLVPGADCTLTGTYVVDTDDVAAGTIDNVATADSVQTDPETDDESTPVPDPELTVFKGEPVVTDDADGSGDISAGDTLTYTVTMTNVGDANLTDVAVTDPLLTPDQADCALVEPGLTCVLTGTYVVTATDITNGSIVNTATADSDQTDPETDDRTTPSPAPDLDVDKPLPVNADEDGSGDVSVGDTLTYTITATNTGDANLTNVVVSDSLITRTGGTSPCSPVAANETCTLEGTYVVTAADIANGQIDNTATAMSDQTGDVIADVSVPVPAPALGILKELTANADEDTSGDVSVGDTLSYTVTATNTGGANLTNVVVTDDLITPSTVTCAAVAPGGTCVLSGTHVVTPGDVTDGSIDNRATADSVQTDEVEDSVTVPTPVPAIELVKATPTLTDDADGSTDISAGDTLTYELTATNIGGANLTNVVVTDDRITPGSIDCGLVLPGETCVLTGTYVVTSDDVSAGDVVNAAVVTSDQAPDDPATRTTPVPDPRLAIDKAAPANADEDGSGDVSAGDTLTYTITATNVGTANLTDLVVSDPLISPTGGSTPCALVAPGGICTLIGTYVVTTDDVIAGLVDNTASADSDQTDAVDDSETTPAPRAAMGISKPMPTNADEDASGDVSEGDTLSYTITVTNIGAARLTNVVVVDGLITTTGGTSPCALLAPGGTCTLTGTYVVTADDVAAGEVVNVATGDSDQTETVEATRVVPVAAPSLSIDKPAPANADEDGSGDVSVGDTLTYTITATNSGTGTLTNVSIVDDLIEPTGGSTPCSLLAPGESCTLEGTYVVTGDDVVAGNIANTATATSDQTGDVTDAVDVPVPQPELTIDKPAPTNADEDRSGSITLGDTLTYTITATNTGTANLTSVTISDPAIDVTGGSAPCALLEPGASCTLTGTRTVSASDIAAGNISNTASADSDQTDDVTDTVVVSTVGSGTISGEIWVDRDRDGVQDPGEPSLSGVTVVLETAGPDGIFGTADDVRRTVVTGPGGYVFDNVPFGEPARVVVDPRTLPGSVDDPTFDLDGLLDNATIITLTPSNPTATGVDFGYAPTRVVPSTGSDTEPIVRTAAALLGAGLLLLIVSSRRRRWRW